MSWGGAHGGLTLAAVRWWLCVLSGDLIPLHLVCLPWAWVALRLGDPAQHERERRVLECRPHTASLLLCLVGQTW